MISRSRFVAGVGASLIAARALQPLSALALPGQPPARALYLQRLDRPEEKTFAYFTRDGIHLDIEGYDVLCMALRDAHVPIDRGIVRMAPALLQLLYDVQQLSWQRTGTRLPIIMHSGYRTLQTNAAIENAAFRSWHCAGAACDLHIEGVPLVDIKAMATESPLLGGCGIYLRGPGRMTTEGWIHLDVADRRDWNG